jgi:hypothetical protein
MNISTFIQNTVSPQPKHRTPETLHSTVKQDEVDSEGVPLAITVENILTDFRKFKKIWKAVKSYGWKYKKGIVDFYYVKPGRGAGKGNPIDEAHALHRLQL